MKPYPVFNVTDTSEEQAFKTILGQEINYARLGLSTNKNYIMVKTVLKSIKFKL